MSFYEARAKQPEIVRTIQKDVVYTDELGQQFSDILRLTSARYWIRYNHLCKMIAEIVYHGFASLNNLQTLGEEYTGIIQINSSYVKLPHKILQLTSIILEFGGDFLYLKILTKLEKQIVGNDDLLPEAKAKLLTVTKFMKGAGPYIKAAHKSLFYYNASKYQISKRFTGINYVLIRHWLSRNRSLQGFRMLSIFSGLHLVASLLLNFYEAYQNSKPAVSETPRLAEEGGSDERPIDTPTCTLCLEPRMRASATMCGHIFCWDCIQDWLNERQECPICREFLDHSSVIPLRNIT